MALLLLAAPLSADYKDSFRKGMEALDRKRWDEVVRYMREAITEKPAEGERLKLYGLRFETYLPHFYLGAAYLNLGNCDAAVKEFDQSRSQGAIRNHPRYAELLDGMKSCEGAKPGTPAPPTPAPALVAKGPDPAAVSQAVQGAEAAIQQAEASAGTLGALAGDALLAPVWSREAPLGGAAAEARETLAAARAKLDAGRRAPGDLALLGEARDLAGRARERLEGVRIAAERRREALQAIGPSHAPPSPEPLRGSRAVPADLLAGAEAYFGGRYDQAVKRLDQASGLWGRSAAQAALLRGAARFALFRMGGEKDPSLRAQAAGDVSACRRADTTLQPDPGAFSPEFVAFFRATP
jgi:tetratricopeptide (TPR) repeat protein